MGRAGRGARSCRRQGRRGGGAGHHPLTDRSRRRRDSPPAGPAGCAVHTLRHSLQWQENGGFPDLRRHCRLTGAALRFRLRPVYFRRGRGSPLPMGLAKGAIR
ncbi:hypothetical protein MTBUT4_70116 [Magnetospirillum sp. UT-4]|nr:hypothetical protein MTBUT4_70116 [Magnetospirillum sp. UT-4]